MNVYVVMKNTHFSENEYVSSMVLAYDNKIDADECAKQMNEKLKTPSIYYDVEEVELITSD